MCQPGGSGADSAAWTNEATALVWALRRVPLQGEGDELEGFDGVDHCVSVPAGQRWDEQYPVDIGLFGPAHGGEVGVGEHDGGRRDLGFSTANRGVGTA